MIKFLDGDKTLFEGLKKSFENGLTKAVSCPGNNSKAYLLSSTTNNYFIKPVLDASWKKEVIAYELAKKLGIDQYFLPVTAFKLQKNNQEIFFSATPMLKEDFTSIQDFEFENEGSMNGILYKYIQEGISHKLAVFDYLIKNKDRHRGNVLTNGTSILLIDHDQAFSDKNYWIPAYLRKSNWKDGDNLPDCGNINELETWFKNLSFKSEFLQQRYNEIKEAPGSRIDEKINHVWRKS